MNHLSENWYTCRTRLMSIRTKKKVETRDTRCCSGGGGAEGWLDQGNSIEDFLEHWPCYATRAMSCHLGHLNDIMAHSCSTNHLFNEHTDVRYPLLVLLDASHLGLYAG